MNSSTRALAWRTNRPMNRSEEEAAVSEDQPILTTKTNQYSISREAPQGSHFFRVEFLQTDTLIVTFRQTSWRGSWSASLTLISSPACGLLGTPKAFYWLTRR